MRTVIRMYLTWQRVEVALVALLVPGLIFESSIANGWVYAGGSFSNGLVASVGLLRGFFFESLTYITARQAYLLCRHKNWFGCSLMALVSLVAMYVSAANNLGWVMAGHDLAGMFSTLGHVMGGDGPLLRGYEFFLAVLLPVSVGAIALVPLDHFFEHALEQDHLDNHAVLVDERHMHRTGYLKAQRKQAKVIQEAYEDIAEDRAQTFIEQVRLGDFSFGANPAGLLALPAAQSLSSMLVEEEDEEDDEEDDVPAAVPSHRRNTITGTVWPANGK